MDKERTVAVPLEVKDTGAAATAGLSNPVGLIRADATQDEIDLARWGKRQQLKRNFSFFSIVAFTVTLMITWQGMLGTFQAGFLNGGPSGLIYGFLVTWIGVMSQTLVTAELGSMMPLAGAQYNWVAVLSPPWCSKFLSYLTGWLTAIGWQAGLVGLIFTNGGYIQSVLIQVYPQYDPQPWHALLISYASLVIVSLVNTVFARYLPLIEGYIFCVHIFGFLVILIILSYLAPHVSAREVFANFQNVGGWQTQGLSFFIGLTTSMVSFIGIDGACHMAEELAEAPKMIPRSMIGSVMINGILAFAMLIVILFSLNDPDAALNTPTNFPAIEIFNQAVDSNAGVSGLMAILISSTIFASIGIMAGASRMLWAFAREKGLPGYKLLSKVEPKSKIPLYSVGMTAIISALLLLITLGSTLVLEAFISLTTAGVYSAYLISACVMLRKRLVDSENIPWGPFRLGRAGVPITIFMIAYSAQGVFFSFWPVYRQVTAENMNWSSVIFGGTLLISITFWAFHGRYVYKGPIIEVRID